MNIKMSTNSQLNLENKLNKQAEQSRYGDHLRVISWKREGGERQKSYKDLEA